MKKFLKAFFPRDGIYETLVGTTGIKPIIKPIGVIVNGYDLKIKVYRNTLTFANLQNTNKCAINIATDSELFILSILEKLDFDIDKDYNLPILKKFNIIFAECNRITDDDPAIFNVIPFDLEINANVTQAYNRGYHISIDFLVNYTRLDIYRDKDLERLLEILKYEYKVIKRTSPFMLHALSGIEEKIRSKGYKLT
ncbi:MAG: DUF447 family protein [Saccharolobus sp.]